MPAHPSHQRDALPRRGQVAAEQCGCQKMFEGGPRTLCPLRAEERILPGDALPPAVNSPAFHRDQQDAAAENAAKARFKKIDERQVNFAQGDGFDFHVCSKNDSPRRHGGPERNKTESVELVVIPPSAPSPREARLLSMACVSHGEVIVPSTTTSRPNGPIGTSRCPGHPARSPALPDRPKTPPGNPDGCSPELPWHGPASRERPSTRKSAPEPRSFSTSQTAAWFPRATGSARASTLTTTPRPAGPWAARPAAAKM